MHRHRSTQLGGWESLDYTHETGVRSLQPRIAQLQAKALPMLSHILSVGKDGEELYPL